MNDVLCGYESKKTSVKMEMTVVYWGAGAPYAALIITHLFVVSSRQRFYNRLRCENDLSLIVLFGTWLSCLKLKFETKGFVKNIEIDGEQQATISYNRMRCDKY